MSHRRIGKWHSSKSRQSQRRPLRTRLLIVCEGKETERNYFDLMKREGWAREHLAVVVKRGKGGSRKQVAQFAVDRKKEKESEVSFDEVWCVMDVERLDDRESMKRAITLLKRNRIKPCLSNPAFEIWFLSHFEKTTYACEDCDAVIRKLNPQWKSRFSRDYEKSERSHYTLLFKWMPAAIENARWVKEEYQPQKATIDCNSSTDVYQLVERLLGRS